ncbi:uncharacterized protein L199_007869 [Kwoniella botswanensis]|uniref:uncharacterized protein n=1 Tax=Kwoniella botswanensis TaxID=1268659 RepID=UPI00315D3421
MSHQLTPRHPSEFSRGNAQSESCKYPSVISVSVTQRSVHQPLADQQLTTPPTRRSSSRVTNPVLYVYDEADDDVFSHGQETEVYEEDGAGKEVEEDDDDEEEEEEEEEEIEDEAYGRESGPRRSRMQPRMGMTDHGPMKRMKRNDQ